MEEENNDKENEKEATQKASILFDKSIGNLLKAIELKEQAVKIREEALKTKDEALKLKEDALYKIESNGLLNNEEYKNTLIKALKIDVLKDLTTAMTGQSHMGFYGAPDSIKPERVYEEGEILHIKSKIQKIIESF